MKSLLVVLFLLHLVVAGSAVLHVFVGSSSNVFVALLTRQVIHLVLDYGDLHGTILLLGHADEVLFCSVYLYQ